MTLPVSDTITAPAFSLQAQGLGKQVTLPSGPLTILENIHIDIAAGQTVAIVGTSGSGKSTLLSLLAGLDTPSNGQVCLDGEVISVLDEDGRARVRGAKVGFVFQNFQLLPALTALENVMLPLELRGDHDIEAPARAILEQVGLGTRLHHYPRQLSGVDSNTGQSIIGQLFALNTQAGTTLILVTHDEALAARCRRVLRLESGRLLTDSAA